jgi:zinc transport system ATP-binding protein
MTTTNDVPPAATAPVVLGARRLVVGYNGKGILPPIDLEIRRAENWVVVGRNGSGKSTLLKTLLRLLAPVDGEIVRPSGVEVSYVAQRHQVEPTVPMRGVDLVAMGRDQDWSFLNPFKTPDSYTDVLDAIRRVGAESYARKRFDAMSGGQQQKIMLAQAIVSKPEVMILDEPTAAMDVVAEQATLDVLGQLRKDLGTAIVLVTHRVSTGLRQADRACYVDQETQAVVVGHPDDVLRAPSFQRQFGDHVDCDPDQEDHHGH